MSSRARLQGRRGDPHNISIREMKQQKGLGRGLDAIFGSEELSVGKAAKAMEAPGEIAITAIFPNPKQPRRHFDEEALAELADSVRILGVIQPVTVKREDDGRHTIISGERRWRAAGMAPQYLRRPCGRDATIP